MGALGKQAEQVAERSKAVNFFREVGRQFGLPGANLGQCGAGARAGAAAGPGAGAPLRGEAGWGAQVAHRPRRRAHLRR